MSAAASGSIRYDGTTVAGAQPESVLLPGHDVPLGRFTTVRRLLPQRPRRMVGAWCFVDHFGPDDVAGRPGMQIPPHPHTGLQTVTWLVDGEILHRDSLGSVQSIVPGQLNLMTAGHGIAHSEQSPPAHPPVMHGLQLWVALPESARYGEPRFAHHAALPQVGAGDARITVVVGEYAGVRSPAEMASPIVGAQVDIGTDAPVALTLRDDFEYALLAMSGTARVDGVELTPGGLLYLGEGRSGTTVTSDGPARLFLLGGEPFDELLVMWWNFVARSHEELVAARGDWTAGRRFGMVTGCVDAPLPAPEMPITRIKARDRHGRTVG
ncbi:pirin family protein [Micromonospora sp. LOL_021]|uniref:pirin family protein n=1 Tax=Micromonospora sp. LOL_021 TaxID=3345417 RepID=UPI003A875C0F